MASTDVSTGDGLTPGWIQAIVGGGIAVLGAVTAIVANTLRIAEKFKAAEDKAAAHTDHGDSELSARIDALDDKLVAAIADVRHTLRGEMQAETGKNEVADQRIEKRLDDWFLRLNERIGALEQEAAVHRDFKRRFEDGERRRE